MTVRSKVLMLWCVAASTLAYAQTPSTEVPRQAVRFSKETSTLQCGKYCVVELRPNEKVRFEASRITSDRTTGVVTLEGSVRVVTSDGEVLAERATITTDSNGVQRIRSDEMRLVSSRFSSL